MMGRKDYASLNSVRRELDCQLRRRVPASARGEYAEHGVFQVGPAPLRLRTRGVWKVGVT